MMSTLNIPINDSIREFTIILMFSFLVRILKGLNVLSNLIILRLIEERSISVQRGFEGASGQFLV